MNSAPDHSVQRQDPPMSAHEYAIALLRLYHPKQFSVLLQALDEISPWITHKHSLIQSLSPDAFHQLLPALPAALRPLLQVLYHRRQLFTLPRIAAALVRLLEHQGYQVATVEAADQFTITQIVHRLGEQFVVVPRLDPEMMAGARIQSKSITVESSINSQLQHLKQTIMSA